MLQQGDLVARRYRTVRLLGTGGFSRVWEAEDLSLQARHVALKELSAPAAGSDDARRVRSLFQREIEALTRLSHPGLPAIHDGFTEGEHHYLVLELVRGENLDDWRAAHTPSVDEVVAWGVEIADILHYLHTREEPLVVRDLKASNLILGEDRHLRLVDLGIAAILRPNAAGTATLAGLGTPGFAAPEQYGRGEVDARTDLYALGATLYFLLAGEPPPDAIDRVLGRVEMEPILARRPETPPGLAHCVAGGLLALEPARRPASAEAARDWLLRSCDAGASQEDSRRRLELLHVLRGHAGRVLTLAYLGARERLLSVSPDDGAFLWDASSGHRVQMVDPAGARLTAAACCEATAQAAVAGPEAGIRLLDLDGGTPPRGLRGVPHGVTSVALAPDGSSVAAGGWDKTVRIWEAATGKPGRVLQGHGGSVSAVAWSPDGRMLVSGSSDRTLRLWNLATGACAAEMTAHHGPVHAVCFVGGGRVASASFDRTVAIWSLTSNVVTHRFRGHADGVTAVCADAEGALVGSGSWDGTVRLWDAASGSLAAVAQAGRPLHSVAMSADGAMLMAGARDGQILVWRVVAG